MFGSYSDVIQTLLAILAAIISLIELRRYSNEKRGIKEKIKTEKQLVETVKNIDVAAFTKNIEGLEIKSDFIVKVKKALDEYEIIYNKTITLYKQLLKDESSFSLSYGFERYINQFRKLCIQGKNIRDELADPQNYAMQQMEAYIRRGTTELNEDKFKELNDAMNEVIASAKDSNWTYNDIKLYLLNEMRANRMNQTAAEIILQSCTCFIDIDKKLRKMGEIVDGTKEMIGEIILKYGD